MLLCEAVLGDLNGDGLLSPLLLLSLSIHKLGQLSSFLPTIYVCFWSIVVFILSMIFFPKVVQLTFKQQMLEGAFRFVHTRVREFAESIVFYKGTSVEEESASSAFSLLFDNTKKCVYEEKRGETVAMSCDPEKMPKLDVLPISERSYILLKGGRYKNPTTRLQLQKAI